MIKEAKFKRVIKRYFDNLTGKRAARIKALARRREAALGEKWRLIKSPLDDVLGILVSGVRADRSILAADAVRKRTRLGTTAAIGIPTIGTLAYQRKKNRGGK